MLPTGICAGWVLAGGASSRMGQDKALMEVNGQPLALIVAQQVKTAVGSVTMVGDRERHASLGLPLVEDIQAGKGPLGGIHAALKNTRSPLNLVVGCDMPFLNAQFLERLVTIAAVADAQVAVAESLEHGYESLCAVYNRSILAAVEECLAVGELKLSRLYERLHVRKLSPEEWQPFNTQGVLFHNVNTPEDFERASKRLESVARGGRA